MIIIESYGGAVEHECRSNIGSARCDICFALIKEKKVVANIPFERRPVTVATEPDITMPYVIVDAYGDKRERFATREEAEQAAREINSSR